MVTVSEVLIWAAQREPQLASYYELHQALLALQEQAEQAITVPVEITEDEVATQTRQGLPAITFDRLPIDPQRFAQLALELARILQDFKVETGDHVLPADDGEWIALARQSFTNGMAISEEAPASHVVDASLAQMATGLALKPYLRRAARQVLPYINRDLWYRGYCPVCGGAPDFAALDAETGARRLLCSRCDAQWPYRRIGCPFCGTTDHTKIIYYLGADDVYRLYVCRACRHYLKTIDMRRVDREVLLPAERIITVAMDAAAQQEGYLG